MTGIPVAPMLRVQAAIERPLVHPRMIALRRPVTLWSPVSYWRLLFGPVAIVSVLLLISGVVLTARGENTGLVSVTLDDVTALLGLTVEQLDSAGHECLSRYSVRTNVSICFLTPPTTVFQQVAAQIEEGRVRRILLWPANDALRLGDLVAVVGKPEVSQPMASGYAGVSWPMHNASTRVRSWSTHQSLFSSIDVLTLTFSEAPVARIERVAG